MNIKIQKPPIPTLWLDTWAIYRLARAIKTNKASDEEKKWAMNIFNRITMLTDQGKMMCPEGDQGLEIRVGGILVDEAEELQVQLSRGVRTHYYKSLEELQIQRVMKATVQGHTEIILPWQDLFIGDPLEKVGKKTSYIVSVKLSQSKTEREKRRRINLSIAKDWERIRKKSRANKEKFTDRLKLEAEGYATAITNMFNYSAKKSLSGKALTTSDLRRFANICGRPLVWWEHYTGEENNQSLKELLTFYLSEDFKRIPAIDVHSHLISKLMTDDEKIKQSDAMDVNQISAIMPYAHFMITDGAMRDKLVYKLKLHDKYGTEIIKIEHLEKLLNSL